MFHYPYFYGHDNYNRELFSKTFFICHGPFIITQECSKVSFNMKHGADVYYTSMYNSDTSKPSKFGDRPIDDLYYILQSKISKFKGVN